MKENIEFDVRGLVKLLLKRAWIIVLCALLGGGTALLYTANFVTPMYRAEVTMYVNNNSGNSDTVSSSNLAVAMQLVNTYVNIIQSNMVLDKVIEETGIMLTPGQVRSMLTAESINETEMFAVRVTSPSPQMSADIANAIADIAPTEISKIIEGSSAKVIDYAVVPTSRVSPSYTVNTVVGALIGGVLSAMFFVVCFLLDTRVKSAEDLEAIYPISVLGEIPDFTRPVQDQKKKVRR